MSELKNIYELFNLQVIRAPEKIAIIFNDCTKTYQEIYFEVDRLSAYLSRSGITKGDKIAVLLPNCTEFVILMVVAAKMGIAIVPQNISHPTQTLAKQFSLLGVKYGVIWEDVLTDYQDQKQRQLFDFEWLAVSRDGFMYKKNNCSPVNIAGVSPDLPYIYTMTSGSTGEPKPIELLQITKIKRVKAAVEMFGLSADDIILAATPLYHSLAERLVILPLITGATSVIMAGFTAVEWLSHVEKYQVTFTMAVSSQLKQVYQLLQDGNDSNLSSLRCMVSSSELLDDDLRKSLLVYFKNDFHECYGASEVACISGISAVDSKIKIGSVGRALPNVQLKIFKDDGIEAEINEIGEIACKTPLAFTGYYQKPELTQAAMHNGFFCTGDYGRLDKDGFLYFHGRKKDIIVTGGINVYPKDIENIINTHPDVLECAVIPLPDTNLGEKVTAIVVPKNDDLSIRNIQRLCAKNLADFQQPREIIFVAALLKNEMGKLVRKKLVEEYTNRVEL